MPKETMTSRERWLAVLKREKPDRIPMDYWATGEATEKLLKHLGCSSDEEMQNMLHLDVPVNVGPRYMGPRNPNGQGDIWGIRSQAVNYGTGVYTEAIYNPLARFHSVEEIERDYVWPEPDWWDYSDIAAQVLGREDRVVKGGGSEPFLHYKSLRGQEQGMMDLVLNPEMVDYCLDKLFELAYQNTLRIFEAIPGRVDIAYVAEDLGAQDRLLMSKVHIRRFLMPRMKRIMDLVRGAGVYVFHHDDGACRDIIPDMIEAGIHILNPIQWRCKGMDREALKRDFGDKVVFHGGVDNQYTLPFGTVAEVEREVLDNLRILGHGGGYILCPCHNIQAVSPPENIVAMYRTALENGWT